MLEELSCENRVVGLSRTRRLLAAGHAGRVFLAKDADPALVEPLLAACRAVGRPAVTELPCHSWAGPPASPWGPPQPPSPAAKTVFPE